MTTTRSVGVALALAAAAAVGAVLLRDSTRSSGDARPAVDSDTEAPIPPVGLAGRASDDAQPGSAPSAPTWLVSGVVRSARGLGRASVWLRSTSRVLAPPILVARTDDSGRFQAELARDRVRGWTAAEAWATTVDPPGASDYLLRDLRSGAPLENLELELREGANATVRLVDGSGAPAAHGAAVFVVETPDHGTQVVLGAADAGGRVHVVLPAGAVTARGRGASAFGDPSSYRIHAGETRDLGAIVVPSAAVRLRVRVEHADGTPVPHAMVRTTDFASKFLADGPVGDLVHYVADADGEVALPPLSRSAFPLDIAAAGDSCVPGSLRLEAPPPEPGLVRLRLRPRPQLTIRLERPGGGPVPDCVWTVAPVDRTAAPADPKDPTYPLELRSSMPRVERLQEGLYRVVLPRRGSYRCEGVLAGGSTVSADVHVDSDVREQPVVVPLPPGRSARLRARMRDPRLAMAAADGIELSWVGPSDGAGERPAWGWTPAGDGDEVVLWCPDGARALRVAGSGARVPWRPQQLVVPASEDEPMTADLDRGLDEGGVLVVRLGEAANRVRRAGTTVAVVAVHAQTAFEAVLRATDPNGEIRVLVPAGRYRAVAPDRTEASVADVAAGQDTVVWLPELAAPPR